MDLNSGVVRTRGRLDRELRPSYLLTVTVSDNGVPSLSTRRHLSISLTDVNDNAPVFSPPSPHLLVAEATPRGGVVGVVTATDSDVGANAVVRYSLLSASVAASSSSPSGGDDAARFRVDARNGTLYADVDFDYEDVARRHYTLVVRAASAHLIADAVVLVSLTDSNDHRPVAPPRLAVVLANYAGGGHFPAGGRVCSLPGYDPDEGDRLRYSAVRGNSARLIHVDEATGVLTLDSRLNSDVTTNATMTLQISGS